MQVDGRRCQGEFDEDSGSMMDRNEQESAWTGVSQRAHSMLEAFGSRTSYEDSYGSS